MKYDHKLVQKDSNEALTTSELHQSVGLHSALTQQLVLQFISLHIQGQ